MFYVLEGGSCCGAGRLGVRLGSDATSLCILCDECYSVFSSPETIEAHQSVRTSNSGVVEGKGFNAFEEGSRWATKAEIELAGWLQFIVGEDPAGNTFDVLEPRNSAEISKEYKRLKSINSDPIFCLDHMLVLKKIRFEELEWLLRNLEGVTDDAAIAAILNHFKAAAEKP